MAEATDNRKEETSDFPPGFHPGPLNKFYNPIRMIRDLAKKQKSGALAQLASRVASAVRFAEEPGRHLRQRERSHPGYGFQG